MSVETIDETPVKAKRGRPARAAVAAPATDHTAVLAAAMESIAKATAALAAIGVNPNSNAAELGKAMAAALEENRVARLASNPDPNFQPHSIFEPHGPDRKPLPKPMFARDVYVNNSPERREALRPDEVHAYNVLSASLPNAGQMRRARGGKWSAEVSRDGQRLMIYFPCKGVDDQLNGPKGILALCKELTDGTEVASVDGMLTQMLALQKQNAEIMAILKSRPDLAALVPASV